MASFFVIISVIWSDFDRWLTEVRRRRLTNSQRSGPVQKSGRIVQPLLLFMPLLTSCYLERIFSHGQCVTMHWQLEGKISSWCNVRLITNIDFNSSQKTHLATCEFKQACSSRIQISKNTYKIHRLLFLFPSQDQLPEIRKSADLCLTCLVPIFVGHINGRVLKTGWWAERLDVTTWQKERRTVEIS